MAFVHHAWVRQGERGITEDQITDAVINNGSWKGQGPTGVKWAFEKLIGSDTLRVAGEIKPDFRDHGLLGRKMSATVDSVPIEVVPVVEIDTEAPAAYIRTSRNAVSRTIVLRDDEILSTMDLDASGKLIGIEVVWPTEFGIEKLLAESRTKLVFTSAAIGRTRYVSAKDPHTDA
jgi:uncharacterized protein YuzE